MYVILDNTMSTLGDLLGFEGSLNTSTPFNTAGYKVEYKTDRHYLDFDFSNTLRENCDYPRFWNDSGQRVLAEDDSTFAKLDGCFDSEFDQVCKRTFQRTPAH
jgi:alpha-1,3-glucan synthase